MATIIQFLPSSKPCKIAQALKRVSAEIVIFPGIRYERVPDDRAVASSGKPRRSRKKLRLQPE